MKKFLTAGFVAVLGLALAAFFLVPIFIVAGIGTPRLNGSTNCLSQSMAAPAAVNVSDTALWPSQIHYAEIIIGVAENRHMSARDAAIGVATAMQESTLSNPHVAVDSDSVGMFQQRPSQGWGPADKLVDPVIATNKFFNVLATIKNRNQMSITQAAQAVQNSGRPGAYQQWAKMATRLANQAYAHNGGGTGIGAALTGCNAPAQTATSPVLAKVVKAALSQLGVPYVWGGVTPKGKPGAGLDCSGLTQYAYAQAGIAIPRVANDQYNTATIKVKPTLANLQPGDLLFENWDEGGAGSGWGHVGMYVGGGKVIQEPQPSQNAEIVSLGFFAPVAAARPLAARHQLTPAGH